MSTPSVSDWYAVLGRNRVSGEALPGMARAVLAAKVEALWKTSPFLAGALVAFTPYFIFAFAEFVSAQTLLVWAACVLLTLGIRLLVYLRFRRVPAENRDSTAWLRYIRIVFPMAALAFGALPLVALPQDASVLQLALAFSILTALSLGTLAFFAAYDLVVFGAYSAALFLPALSYVVFAGRWLELTLMLSTVIFIVPVGRRIHALVSGAFETREALKIEKAAAEIAREEADRANRAKSRFLAAASHDLRQPMHALTLFVTALKESPEGPDAHRLVDRIVDSVAALDHLFEALLDISKLDAGVITPKIESFPLQSLLQRLEDEYAQAAREKGLDLRVAACAATVRSDPALLERVLRNFLSNAVRYTATGHVAVQCTINQDRVQVEVADTGIGIPQQHLDDVFQEFYQVDNPERDRGKGLGLGLAIVKRVCELLNHPLAVRSTPGSGSAFAVEVPLGESVATARTEAHGEAGLQGAFVLVVDDETAVAEATFTLLSASGCHVLSASTGAEALRELSRHERLPDAVICDYRLRAGETGLDVIAAIHSTLGEAIPALLITGDTSPERLQEAAASGYHILHKPVDPSELRRVLAREIAALWARRNAAV